MNQNVLYLDYSNFSFIIVSTIVNWLLEIKLFLGIHLWVNPVLKGHNWDKEKVVLKEGDILNEVQSIWNFLWQDKTRFNGRKLSLVATR
jgi:hypothetical protein